MERHKRPIPRMNSAAAIRSLDNGAIMERMDTATHHLTRLSGTLDDLPDFMVALKTVNVCAAELAKRERHGIRMALREMKAKARALGIRKP